jgi:hypothetical protein
MGKHIPLKWTDEEVKYFSKPLPIVERVSWFDKLDDWFIWFVIAFMAGATIWIFIKIYQLSLIRIWLKTI